MGWDLYIDESGTFDTVDSKGRREHNLIGGFILPQGRFSRQADPWFKQIRHAVYDRFGSEQLDHINKNNRWKRKKSDPDEASHEEFDFTHACNNRAVSREIEDSSVINDTIRQAQLMILDEYRQRIESLDGKIVVFDDPTGEDFGGNTPNYLTILGKGIVALYSRLQQITGEISPDLYLHIARRSNQERDANGYYTETSVISLRGNDRRTIDENQYRKTIKHMAFGLADAGLRSVASFRALFEDESRIVIEDDGQDVITIPCDFICNSYYRGYRNSRWNTTPEYIRTFADADNTVIVVVGDVMAVESSEYVVMKANRTYFSMFLRLEALGFQRESMQAFFAAFNDCDPIDRQTFVSQLVESLRQPVSRSASDGTMSDLISRIEGMLRILTDSSIQDMAVVSAIRANLYLYLATLYSHLGQGQQVKSVDERFTAALKGMARGEARLELQLKYLNHRVVTLTDGFQFREAEDIFINKMAPHWDMQAELAGELFADESFGAEEYGREIGSYLMLQKHRLRVSDVAYRKAHGNDIASWYDIALAQFSGKDDLGRCYLNICGVETELEHYPDAFRYLEKAVGQYYPDKYSLIADDVPFDKEQLEQICKLTDCVSSDNNHAAAQPWVFYQYVRLASDMAATGKPDCLDTARRMFEAACQTALSGATFDWINNHFLRAIIKWRMASLMINLGVQKNIAIGYLKTAADDMSGSNSAPLLAISTAVRSRLIAFLIESDRIKDALSESRLLNNVYNRFCKLTDSAGTNNPFIDNGSDLDGYMPPCYINAQDVAGVVYQLQSACNEKNPKMKLDGLEKARENCLRIHRIIAY